MTEQEKLLQITESFKKSVDETKAIAEEIKGRYAHNDKVTSEMKEKADEAIKKTNELTDQITELKKHISTIENREQDGGIKQLKTAGQLVTESAEFKGKSNWSRGDNLKVGVKSITNSGENSAGVLHRPEYVGHVDLPQPELLIYDLLSHGSMSIESIYFTQELGFENNAAVVKEGEEKPESFITFKDCVEDAVVIAHHINASRQALSDASQLQTLIDTRLRYGLLAKREQQILFGKGRESGEMNGIMTQATQYKAPTDKVKDVTYLDTLRLAILQAVLAEYPVDGLVLNPIDASIIELAKDGEGRYIIGNPTGLGITSLWGKPVVQTQSMGVNQFLAGAFKLGATYFDRWDATVAISYEHSDNFTHNKATILAEERGALAVYRPEAFVKGSFDGSAGASGDGTIGP